MARRKAINFVIKAPLGALAAGPGGRCGTTLQRGSLVPLISACSRMISPGRKEMMSPERGRCRPGDIKTPRSRSSMNVVVSRLWISVSALTYRATAPSAA